MGIVLAVIGVVVTLCVIIHYECLHQMTRLFPRTLARHRLRMVLGVIGALVAHTVEVWIFAFAYYGLHHADGMGKLGGNYDGSLQASVYYSFTTYSTLGLGDIEPFGAIRLLTGIEAVVGLLLIAWTASYLYFEMTRHWTQD